MVNTDGQRRCTGDDAIEAVMVDFSSQWLRVAVPASAAAALATRSAPWRVDLYANTTAHQRCAAAINTIARGAFVDYICSRMMCGLVLPCAMPFHTKP